MAPISLSISPPSSIPIPIPTPKTLNHLLPRQSSSSDNPTSSCPSTISSGGIAGIVIGSIAGTLLLIWLWRTCMTTRAINEAEETGGAVYTNGGGYPTHEATTHHRRRRRRVSPGLGYEYAEKGRSRSDGRGGRGVRKPRRVYLAS